MKKTGVLTELQDVLGDQVALALVVRRGEHPTYCVEDSWQELYHVGLAYQQLHGLCFLCFLSLFLPRHVGEQRVSCCEGCDCTVPLVLSHLLKLSVGKALLLLDGSRTVDPLLGAECVALTSSRRSFVACALGAGVAFLLRLLLRVDDHGLDAGQDAHRLELGVDCYGCSLCVSLLHEALLEDLHDLILRALLVGEYDHLLVNGSLALFVILYDRAQLEPLLRLRDHPSVDHGAFNILNIL